MNDDQLRSAFADLLSDLPAGTALPPATARRVARRRGRKLAAGAVGGVGALALAVTLAVTAGPSDDRLSLPADPPTNQPAPSSAPVQPTPSPTGVPSPAVSDVPATARVVLRPDGLGLAAGSSTSSLEFGADAAAVRAAVDRALGAGGERATPDCGEGSSTVQHEGLFLLLQGGEFVGWVSGSPGLTTGDGIGVGSSLAELRAAYGRLELTEGTVGTEWTTGDGGISGFLDGAQDGSLVTSVSAGVRCIAR